MLRMTNDDAAVAITQVDISSHSCYSWSVISAELRMNN